MMTPGWASCLGESLYPHYLPFRPRLYQVLFWCKSQPGFLATLLLIKRTVLSWCPLPDCLLQANSGQNSRMDLPVRR